MQHHRWFSLALGLVFLVGPRPAHADDTDKTYLHADRPFLFQVEAVYSYIQTEAKLSSEIGVLTPILGQGQTTTATLLSSNVGGEVRILGPLLLGVLRPFVEGGGVTPPPVDTITSSNYGIPGRNPQTNASLEYDWQANAALGVSVDMPIGPSILSFKPSVGWAWDAYAANINFFLNGLPGVARTASGNLVPAGRLATNSAVTAHYTVGSVQFAGNLSFQPIATLPVYIFGMGGWRKPLTNYHRNQCDDTDEIEGLTACAHYNIQGGAFFRTGIGVQF